jgi:hypothetical protein
VEIIELAISAGDETMAAAEGGMYRLAIQPGPNGGPVMVLEPIDETVPDQSDRMLAVALREGTTEAEVMDWLIRFNEQVAGSPPPSSAPPRHSA